MRSRFLVFTSVVLQKGSAVLFVGFCVFLCAEKG